MKVDRDVERAVRSAFAGSVTGESERFDAAVAAIASKSEDFLSQALTLAHAVDYAALFSIHEGRRPGDERLQYLARRSTEQENDWADIEESVSLSFLISLADRKSPLGEISAVDVTFISFAIGGWLLSAFIPEDEEWTDFLDAILKAFESSPG